jgi:hypothetical protein
VWCLRKPGRDLHEKTELLLAWRRVVKEIAEGTLGAEFDHSDRVEVQSKVSDAEEAVRDEVWAGYRFVLLADSKEPDGLKVIDLGAGHASSGETLCGRVIAALKSEGLLNERMGAGFIDRHWPDAFKESGAWPLKSLRQSFLDGSLTRLLDPDAVLRSKIVEFVGNADFGLGSGQKPDGTYERVWYEELIAPDEVAFEPGVFLLTKGKAKALKGGGKPGPGPEPGTIGGVEPRPEPEVVKPEPGPEAETKTLHLAGNIPPELWNRFGTKILPKLRSGEELRVGIDISVTVRADLAQSRESEIRQILSDLGLSDRVRISSE